MQFRRRMEKKTDYAQRFALLKSDKPRLVVRRTNSSLSMQIVEFHPQGDRTLAEVASTNLRKFGWKGHCGNMPAAYLCGLLLGKEAGKKSIGEAVPDLGMQMSVRGSVLYACLLGAKDAGLRVNIGKDALPKMERVEGRHIAAYSEALKSKDGKKFERQFSGYIKKGIMPEKLPEHFNEIKNKILQEA